MFFILSKVFAFLFSPVNWIVFALLIGFFSRKPRRKRRAYIAAVVLFFVFTNSFISRTSMRVLEVRSEHPAQAGKTYPAGILLGGLVNLGSDTSRVGFNANGDRLFQTMNLYNSGVIEKIVITSGSGFVQHPSFREADLIRKYLTDNGFPKEDIWIETRSRNTYENAKFTRELLIDKMGAPVDEEFLLITSATHMKRAVACFEKQGIRVRPYSTTFRGGSGPFHFEAEMILPDPFALGQWKNFFHEIIGLAAYKVTGKV